MKSSNDKLQAYYDNIDLITDDLILNLLTNAPIPSNLDNLYFNCSPKGFGVYLYIDAKQTVKNLPADLQDLTKASHIDPEASKRLVPLGLGINLDSESHELQKKLQIIFYCNIKQQSIGDKFYLNSRKKFFSLDGPIYKNFFYMSQNSFKIIFCKLDYKLIDQDYFSYFKEGAQITREARKKLFDAFIYTLKLNLVKEYNSDKYFFSQGDFGALDYNRPQDQVIILSLRIDSIQKLEKALSIVKNEDPNNKIDADAIWHNIHLIANSMPNHRSMSYIANKVLKKHYSTKDAIAKIEGMILQEKILLLEDLFNDDRQKFDLIKNILFPAALPMSSEAQKSLDYIMQKATFNPEDLDKLSTVACKGQANSYGRLIDKKNGFKYNENPSKDMFESKIGHEFSITFHEPISRIIFKKNLTEADIINSMDKVQKEAQQSQESQTQQTQEQPQQPQEPQSQQVQGDISELWPELGSYLT